MIPITDPDTTNTSQQYWEEVLISHGLGEQRARATTKTVLRGGIRELVGIEESEYEKSTGKVKPFGRGPEH